MSALAWAGFVVFVFGLFVGATLLLALIGGGRRRDADDAKARQALVDVKYTRACAESMRRHPASRLPGTHQVSFDQPWERHRD